MKKSLIVASLLLVGSSVLVAAEMDNSWFVGGEFGAQKMKFTGTDTVTSGGTVVGSDTETAKVNATYEALKVGKYFEYGRVYGSLGKQNKKDELSSYSLGLGYDYMFKNKSDFTPFLGANASYTKGKIDDSTDKPKGLNYGIEAGIVYAATKNVELELGARYMKSNVDFSGSDTYGSVVESFKVEADNFIQYYVGLNYKF